MHAVSLLCCYVTLLFNPSLHARGQEKVSKPSAEQMAVLEEQFGEKQKAKQKKEDETVEETTTLHGELGNSLCLSHTHFSPTPPPLLSP